MYKFDPHTHTEESSLCAIAPARKLVNAYHKAGFGGIAITDHLAEYVIQRRGLGWDDFVTSVLAGYKAAKRHGDNIGLDVIHGVEMSFINDPSDYLIYGIDEEFLRENPFVHKLGLKKFYQRFGDRFLIIQAHPFRNGNKASTTGCIHGIEVFNGNPWGDNNNDKARAFHDRRPNLLPFSSSDAHSADPKGVGRGWLELEYPVKTANEFKDLVLRRDYEIGFTGK